MTAQKGRPQWCSIVKMQKGLLQWYVLFYLLKPKHLSEVSAGNMAGTFWDFAITWVQLGKVGLHALVNGFFDYWVLVHRGVTLFYF